MKDKILNKLLQIIIFTTIGLICHSCATIGNPEGGPRDEDPPRLISSDPLPNSLNVNQREMKLVFDELVQIISQNDKVVVSPVQKQPAIIKASGRAINIEFQDTLLENTTYSIDFSDAIADLNEKNTLMGFSYSFSTGDSLDIHQISGMLLNARDLEPQQNIVVGVHTNFDDTTFKKTPLVKIAKTNDRGAFTIRNLKRGEYKLFAIKDANNDYKFDSPTEDIAFYNEIIIPEAKLVTHTDTIFNEAQEIDTIIENSHYHHAPNNILLSMFNEEFKSQYLVKNERQARNKLYLEFAAAADTLPEIRLLGDSIPSGNDWYIVDRSETNDSITYWLTDTTVMANDSIRIEARYLRTDSTQQLSPVTDTIAFNMRITSLAKEPKKEKSRKDDELAAEDSIPPIKFIDMKIVSKQRLDIYAPIFIDFTEPIDSIGANAVTLEIKKDSIWESISDVKLERISDHSLLKYKIENEWTEGGAYKLTIDSAAIYGIYGLFNKPITQEFSMRTLDEYSNLYVNVNTTDSAYVELLNNSDKVISVAPVIDGVATFLYTNPGDYYLRLFIDSNGNGEYDTGNYDLKRQPEDVYYYPKKITLKQNWDVDQTWNINAEPVDKQKPEDIKKNKPVKTKKELEIERKLKEQESKRDDSLYV